MNNGTRKGGEPETMRVVHSSPGFEDLWQIHFSQLSGQEYTQPGMFIAHGVDEPLAAMPNQPVSAPGPGANAPPLLPTTARPIGSSCRRSPTALSPSQQAQRLIQDYARVMAE